MKCFRIAFALFSFFVCMAVAMRAKGQVTASFTASAISGCAPLIVNFTNTSTGATSYSWNLGNTNTSFLQNASGSYSSPGTYTVSLTATGTGGSNTSTMQIVVNPPPAISFTTAITTVCPGVPVTFSNTTSLMVTGSGTYNWNFGDGDTSAMQSAAHAYTTPGVYSVTQTATNSGGCSASKVINNYITVLAKPTVQFTVSNNNFCATPAQVTFTDQSAGNGTLNHTWRFGDNTATSPATSPVHIYNATGIYTITEIATDNHGCTDSATVNNAVRVQNLVAAMNVPDTGCTNQPVTFINSTAGTSVGSYWFFGNGDSDLNVNTTYTYLTPGLYTVKLVAYVNSCSDTVTQNIYIRPVPTAGFTFTPVHPCPAPINVQFTSTAPAGSTYTWNFGDGGTSTLANPSYTYNTNSFFPVSMAINSNGCLFVVSDSVNIYPLVHDIKLHTTEGCAPLTVSGIAEAWWIPPLFSIFYPYPIVSTKWNLGDGTPTFTVPGATGAFNHVFVLPGTYPLQDTVTTANGCVFTDTSKVGAGMPPVLDSFFVTPTHVCRRDSVFLYTHAHGVQPINYTFDFGGFLYDSVQIRVYGTPGVYQANVILSNYGCSGPGDTSANIAVIVDSPGASFTINQPCDTPLQVDFISGVIGATSVLWDFGDGSTTSAVSPQHVYSSPGRYNVKLEAHNSRSGCTDSAGIQVVIYNLIPKILVSDTAICEHTVLVFNGTYNMPNPPPITHLWSIDNNPLDTSLQTVYKFDSSGIYLVSLVDTDNHNCVWTTTQKILVAQPKAGLIASPSNICLPAGILFSDSSYYISGTYAVSHAWSFGDGATNITANAAINHSYTAPGSFTVQEIVIDNLGCTDTIIRTNYITTHKPIASFAIASPNKCAGDTITFVNTGTQNLLATYWTFGDGASSTALVPVHAYGASGTYTVSMAITDSAGCHDTLVRTSYISISEPHAAFSEVNGSGVCTPLITQFHNTSTGGAAYAWSFGNGSTSVATNPTNSYTIPGSYNVQLLVTDVHGCRDSVSGHVTLYGYSGAFRYSPLTGCPPLHVNFTTSITGIPSITWDFSDGTVTSPSANPTATHTYTNPGKYVPKILLTDSAGCHTSSYGADTIRVDKAHAGFTQTQATCVYDTVHFTDNSSGLFTPVTGWLWFTGDGSSTGLQNPTHSYATAGNYTIRLIATDAAGCSDTAVSTLTIHPLPNITTTGDTTICPGDSAIVTAKGGISFLWVSAGAIACTTCNPTYITPTTSGSYMVTGTDTFGCKNTDSVTIGFTYKTISYPGTGGQICTGQSITLSDSGAQKYSWYPDVALSDSHSPHTVASPTYGITYLAIAQTASCIPDTGYLNVVVNPLPQVTAIGGATVIGNSKVNLQAYGAGIVSFLWSNADILSCDDCSDPIATMQQTTQFTVTAINQYGCEDSAHVTVDVLCDKSQVFIPNTFTPNGDGQNDVFYPRGVGIKVVRSFRIYNRWGELVFQRNNIQMNDEKSGWDGSFNGAKPVPDTYVYAVDAICDNGNPIDWKGDVSLIK